MNGRTVTRNIVWRCASDIFCGADFACNQVRILQVSQLQRDVDPALDQPLRPRIQKHHDLDVGVLRGELLQGGNEKTITDPGGHFEDKPATGSREEKNVNIRVPIALVRGGMRLGTIIGFHADDEVQRRLREHGFDLDLSKIDKADIDNLLNNLGEMTLNVDKGKSQVRISCE